MSRGVKIMGFIAIGGMTAAAVGAVATGKLPLLKKPSAVVANADANKPVESAGAAVTVERVVPMEFKETLLVTGTLVPRDEILVGPEVEGLRIVEVLADEGDRVTKGQVLARLVNDTIDAQLAQNDAGIAKSNAGIAQARSNVVSAEAKYSEAKNAYERGKPLRQSGYLSEALIEQREATAKSAQAALAASKDALKAAEADKAQVDAQRKDLTWRRGRTDIAAPADGIVSRRVARVGGFAAGAGEPMFRIIAKGDIELEAEIPETRMSRVRPGQSVTIDIMGLPSLVAKVRLVSPEIDKATRLGKIRVLIGNDQNLRIGSFARGTIATDSGRGLAVPTAAVLYAGEQATVQVVKDGRIEVRKVTLGLTDGARIEVRNGLVEGDLVVARSGTFLRPGDAVRPLIDGKSAGAGPDAATTATVPTKSATKAGGASQ